jgi:hypothetical protein
MHQLWKKAAIVPLVLIVLCLGVNAHMQSHFSSTSFILLSWTYGFSSFFLSTNTLPDFINDPEQGHPGHFDFAMGLIRTGNTVVVTGKSKSRVCGLQTTNICLPFSKFLNLFLQAIHQ